MSERRTFVVVSIVHWNTPVQTIACLDALRESTHRRYRVVVVDNGSSDGSVALLHAAHPDVNIVLAGENLGFAAGHLVACRQAQTWGADAIWLLNSDALVEPQALVELVAAYEAHGDAIYGAVPLHRREDGVLLLNFPAKFLDPRAVPRAFGRDAEMVFEPRLQSREVLPVGAVSGSAMFLPLALVEAHGWLDLRWFMQCEEIDYCYALRARGVACLLVTRACVWHAGAGSASGRAGVADALAYYHARNEILLARRHAGGWTAALIALKKCVRAAITLATRAARARLVLRGAWDGVRGRGGKRVAPESLR